MRLIIGKHSQHWNSSVWYQHSTSTKITSSRYTCTASDCSERDKGDLIELGYIVSVHCQADDSWRGAVIHSNLQAIKKCIAMSMHIPHPTAPALTRGNNGIMAGKSFQGFWAKQLAWFENRKVVNLPKTGAVLWPRVIGNRQLTCGSAGTVNRLKELWTRSASYREKVAPTKCRVKGGLGKKKLTTVYMGSICHQQSKPQIQGRLEDRCSYSTCPFLKACVSDA